MSSVPGMTGRNSRCGPLVHSDVFLISVSPLHDVNTVNVRNVKGKGRGRY